MISLLLACTHAPPVLYPTPAPRLDLGELPPANGPRPVVMDEGDTAPHVGVLATPDDWARLKTRSRILSTSAEALAVCHEGRDRDRAYAQQYATDLDSALTEARANARALRAGGVAAFLLGGLVGSGLAIGVAWAYPR